MSDDGTGSPKDTSKQEPQSPLTPGSPEQKQQLERELTAIFTSINQPQDISQEDLQDAAKKVASDIQTEVANILRRSARLSNKRAAEADTEGLKLVDTTDENINNMAKLLVPYTGMSSGDSVGSQFSQHLLGIAQNLNILPPQDDAGSKEYNTRIQEILSKLGVTTSNLKIRDVYNATKGAKEIGESQQFTDVWGPSIAVLVRRDGFCYLSGWRFSASDSPEMDHVKFATSAFMECIHYRDLQNKRLCDTKVSKLWQDFIKTLSGIDLLWNLYQQLNQGTINKKGVRLYSSAAVNDCYANVFSEFKRYIQTKCPGRVINENIFNYSTHILKFWLAEFAYALHIFNQAKGGLNLNGGVGINEMNKSVKRRLVNNASDPKTLREYNNHSKYFNDVYLTKGRLGQNNDFIAGRVEHLEKIAAEFKESGYGCVSSLAHEQLDNPELVSVIILMRQLRNILLYSVRKNGLATLAARDINAVDMDAAAEPSYEDILKELQSEIEKLQNELTTNNRATSRSKTKMQDIQKQIDNIIDKKGVSQEDQDLGNLINSQKDLGNLITSQQATRGLFATTNAERRREQTSDPGDSIQINQAVLTGNVTPPPPPQWGPPLEDSGRVLKKVTEGLRANLMNAPVGSVVDKKRKRVPDDEKKSGKKGGTLKNKRRTQKRITSRRRKITKRLMSRRKRYTRKQKK